MRAVNRVGAWLGSLNPVVKDGFLALVLAATLVLDLNQSDLPPDTPLRQPDALGYVLVAMMILPLAWRRVYPLAVYTVVLAATASVAILFYRPTSFGFGLIVATYTVARWCERRVSLWTLGIGLAFGVLIKVRAIAVGIGIPWFDWPLDAVYFGAAWFLGDSIRTRKQYANELERNRQTLARQAVAEERMRIARELHDAIGHSVSVMVLQAGGGEELLDRDPQRARGAFRSIAAVGRDALADMDSLVGLLRDSGGDNRSTQPSLERIDALLDGYRDLGLEIHAAIEEEPRDLPPGIETSAYRIIEEALTNIVKHAGPAKTEVSLAYGGGEVHLRVRDHGGTGTTRPLDRADHEGRGLVGMHERAALVGGDAFASPHPDGGFIVVANLPYEETRR